MLTEVEREREIARRARAGSAEIPKSHPEERIVTMVTFADTLFLLSQRNIFRVRTADEIDPEVTQSGVPWTISVYLSIGTRHKLISSSFGMLKELSKFVIYKKENQERIASMLMEFAVCAAEMEFAQDLYDNELKALIDKNSDGLTLVGAAAQLPRVGSFEISFSIFFSAAKRALGKLLAILEWSCGFEIRNGTQVDKLANRIRDKKKLASLHPLLPRLEGFKDAVKLVNEIRNSFEHPSTRRSVILSNVALMPDGRLRAPTWTLIHDELTLPPDQDYGVHLSQITDMISRLSEMVLLLAAAREDPIFQWVANPKASEDIDADFPCKWKIDLAPQTQKGS